ncbi:uncharacterized protein B0T23DRAFT_322736 [Neurospora hispaniola]|uniref:Protein kinase domain-containing protein n=1 Tax=Neurospora hispaniola TaxID=588809 RepID=A0AAJ0MNA6_9PEZI|nr:hypothetical protein B0T23DRAFT_322736 [Neurospora hispaniola]
MSQSGANNQLGPKTTQKDQLATESEGEDLSDLIYLNLQEGNPLDGGGIRKFLPEGLLVKYLTEKSIRKKLEENNPSASNVDDLVTFIVHHARKIFATLIRSNFEGDKLCKAIRDFRDHNITDDFLPITETKMEKVPFFKKKGHWSLQTVADFCEKQWTFLAPVLPPPERDGVPLLKVDALTILPFIEAKLVDHGAFGEVYKVMLCPSNMLTEHLQNSYIAVKRLKDPNPEDEQSQRNPGQQWTREVETHAEIQRTHHPHIIDFIAAIERGTARYLLFSWADQGNLESLWKKHKSPLLSSMLVEDVIRQLQGLADALDTLHYCGGNSEDTNSSWRHGDVKPQNILSRSKKKVNESTKQPGSEDQLDIGHLMMSDLGLAKRHFVATEVRNDRTSTRSTTFRYSPPEIYTLEKFEPIARSRRYDIWSMGCVILEFSIWLLYGWHALDDFNKKIITADWGEQCPWFTTTIEPGKGKTAKLHGIVEHTINFILKEDPECRDQTALRELVELVRDKLLVVELGSPKSLRKIPSSCSGLSDTTPNPSIQEQVHVPTIQVPASEENKVDGDSTTKVRAESKDVNDALQQIIKKGQQNKKYWFTGKDRTGIRLDMIRIMTAAGSGYLAGLFPESHAEARLCVKCQELDFFAPKFTIQDTWQDLATNQARCDFCELRWRACLDRKLDSTRKSTTENQPNTSRIKIGLPNLTVTSNQHFALMRRWLEDCDDQHQCKPHAKSTVPTRVLDLGAGREHIVRLYRTRPGDSFRYIALSHCWGKDQHFTTTTSNIKDHMNSIPMDKLPKTFQDAIRTTRELGIQYLWIDSICIVQGDHGDFDKEAKKMEYVFSSAYCVLAASSARSQTEGFLNPRKSRTVVNLGRKKNDIGVYATPFSDDFKKHVVNSPLSERGWVLQERALARRTIYFTEWQTYWECGHGIRCETLTSMDNKLISFLGDPNFPSKLSDGTSDRGEKIRFYEGLYTQYSRLTLTNSSDRPIAIAGLERRLIHDLNCSGGFGVFDDQRSLLQRSLLWQRGETIPTLERIRHPQVLFRVPTWSWMAYKGGIAYLDPPFGRVDWRVAEIRGNWYGQGSNRAELSAKTRKFRMGETGTEDFNITWDIPGEIDIEKAVIRCVVVGNLKQRDPKPMKSTHYVLIVRLREHGAELATDETDIYERVGVGTMLGKYLDLDNSLQPKWDKIR